MAAAAALAALILHEIFHLCAERPNLPGVSTPRLADDALVWAIQNMSAISFLWALSSDFPAFRPGWLPLTTLVAFALRRRSDAVFEPQHRSER